MTVKTAAPTATESLFREVRSRRDAIQGAVLVWASASMRSYPWRQERRTAYEVLIAELLLKRTTATAAARIYEPFLARFPSFEAIVAARLQDLEAALATVGLQRQRARALTQLAAYVVERWDGVVPKDSEELLAIPHLGPYAAAAMRSFAFDQSAAIVDSNVERIIRRLFNDSLNGSGPSQVREVAEQILPVASHREFNFGLLDIGALVCRYAYPRCAECPLLAICDYGSRQAGPPVAEDASANS